MRIVIFLFVIVNSIFAHKLNIFLSQENNKVLINTYYASGASCKSCKLEIYNLKNQLISTSKTDGNGDYYINKPKESIVIKVEAIGGHGAKTIYEIDTMTKKNITEKNSTIDSLIQSLVAAILIALIFVFLKRFKK